MHKILLLMLGVLGWTVAVAAPVPKSKAMLVAQNFYNTLSQDISATQLKTTQVFYSNLWNEQRAKMEEVPLFYVFQVNQQDGFVMVAADDAALPILGYNTKGKITSTDLPESYRKWIESYKEQMEYIIKNDVSATTTIREQWSNLIKNVAVGFGRSGGAAYLCQTTWGQQPYYNDQCPYDYNAGSRAVVGCVATAMAQIMKYWGHPAQGTGFHSYNHSSYGTQSVNYGNASYNWTGMPNNVSSSNAEVAKMMYHCGVAVNMQYSPGGSGAYSSDAADALKDYFGYKTSLQYIAKTSYTQTSWNNLLRNEIDNNRPIYYAATGSGGGHAFVCDGYQSGDYFHFNWGWRGTYDGYFHISALNPSGVGTGGGSGGFNSNHRAIVGIQPNDNGGGGTTPATLDLYSAIGANPGTTINYGEAFNIYVDIVNTSGTDYSGSIGAALLDADQNLVDWVETKSSWTLTTGYFYDSLSFSSANLSSTPSPGSYYIAIYQKETGATGWSAVGDGSYTNAVAFQIETVNSNGMELYAAITPSATPIVQNSSFTVSANFYNNSSIDFSGKLSMDIHDAQGNYLQTIEEKSGMTLAAGYVYSSNAVFSSAGISLDPGTYQIAAWMQPDGGSWELVGNSTYTNPIQADVAAPAIQGDIYENNNTAGAAYTLPLSYTNNVATKVTTGSNIHIGGDYDFYKIVLPTGNAYTIDAQVFDTYNTASGYTNDVLFSYDTGSGYSDSYDNSVSSIHLPNGGTVVFQVASYYQGQTGNYELDLVVSRGPALAVEQIKTATNMKLYPIPADQYLTLEFEELPENLEQVEIINALGQKVYQINGTKLQDQRHIIATENLGNGVYYMLIHSNATVSRKSFMIAR